MDPTQASLPLYDAEQLDAHVAAAVRRERERIAAILDHEEAEGREAFARHIALRTDLAVAECVAILKAAARETPAREFRFRTSESPDLH